MEDTPQSHVPCQQAENHGYPGIARAVVEMSSCNGGLNIDRPVDAVIEDLDDMLADLTDDTPVTIEDLKPIDDWLKSLSREDLITVIDGCETLREAFCEKGPPRVSMFLDMVFDQVA